MSLATTIVENYIFDHGNMTRYDLIYSTYIDQSYGTEMCSITWLKRSTAGSTFVWRKGENIYSTYALEKLNGYTGNEVNKSDLAPILMSVKKRFPGSIGELMGFEEYDDAGCWRG